MDSSNGTVGHLEDVINSLTHYMEINSRVSILQLSKLVPCHSTKVLVLTKRSTALLRYLQLLIIINALCQWSLFFWTSHHFTHSMYNAMLLNVTVSHCPSLWKMSYLCKPLFLKVKCQMSALEWMHKLVIGCDVQCTLQATKCQTSYFLPAGCRKAANCRY